MMSWKFIDTSLLRVGYQEFNPTSPNVVILLHGWPDSPRTWKGVIPYLVDAGYRVIVPALRGAGLKVPVTPDGAFYVWIDCSDVASDSMAFAERLLEEAWVSIVPGHDFGTHQADRYLRLSYATARPLLEEAVDRIARLITAG